MAVNVMVSSFLSVKKSYLFILLVLASCSYFRSDEDKNEPLARAFDRYLYRSDISGIIPPGTSARDSIRIAEGFINNWVRQNVILTQAEKNVTYDKNYIDRQLEDYRNSLIIFSYEQELIRQKLDTVISEKEILDYYRNNPADFELKKSIIKARYIKLKQDAPKRHIVKKWFVSEEGNDLASLEMYCEKYASAYSLTDSSWLFLDELTAFIPIGHEDEERFFKKNRLIEIESGKHVYWILVKDFMYKNSVSPLEFEKENIRSIILNKRKLKLISNMEKDVFTEALKNGDFEIYGKD